MRILQNSLYYLIPLLVFLVLFIFWQRSPVNLLSSQVGSEIIPTFNLPTLFDSEKTLTNKDLKGKVILVNFWASWCTACHIEHPVLLMIKENYRIPIFGIDVQDNPDFAKNILIKKGNPYQNVGFDSNGEMATGLDVQALPQTFLIDAHGVIRYRHKGVLNKAVWERRFLPLIQEIEKI